jgi:hypothetical protein
MCLQQELFEPRATDRPLPVAWRCHLQWLEFHALDAALADPGHGQRSIDGTSEKAAPSVDLHLHLVKMPRPVAGVHALDTALADLGRGDRAKAKPPEPDGPVADVDAALVRKVLDVAQREREVVLGHLRGKQLKALIAAGSDPRRALKQVPAASLRT